MSRLSQLFYGMLAVGLLAGCETNPALHVGLDPVAQQNAAPIASAGNQPIQVKIVDARLLRDRIGQSGSGDDAIPIVATNDVVQVLRAAIEGGLAERGFRLAHEGLAVEVRLDKFYLIRNSDSHWNWIAKMNLSARITKPDGTIVFSKTFSGDGLQPDSAWGIHFSPRATSALDKALKNGIDKLFADAEFIDAILNMPRQ